MSRNGFGYLEILDHAPVLVWHAGIDGQCDWFNRAWLEFTGRRIEQECGEGWAEGVHAEDLGRCVGTYREAFAARRSFRMEYRLRSAAGDYRWIVDIGIPLTYPAGVFNGYIGYCLDIDERKRHEAALHDSEVLLREVQEVGRIGHYLFDVRADRWQSSAVLDRLFGIDAAYPRDFAHWLSLVAPDMREEMADYVKATSLNHGNFDKEFRIVRPSDGIERWVSGLGKIDYDSAGRPLRMIGTVRDITDAVRNTELLRLSASVFEHSQQGILITDAERNILKVNAAFTRLTGYTQDEVAGRNPRLLHSGLQDQRFYEAMWQQIVSSGHWVGEIWNRKKSGEFIAGMLDINAVRNPRGDVSHYVGLFTDITALKTTQRELERMANFDALTGLPNRTLLTDRLQQAVTQARRNDWLLAVCFLDLDEFKPINDRHGHEIGDRLLIEVARRISETLRAGDTVARLGGDEFVVLLPQLEGEAELGQIVDRVLATVSQPCLIDGRPIATSVSIGITLFPDGDEDPSLLLRHADLAMYEAKQLGRNRYCIHRSR